MTAGSVAAWSFVRQLRGPHVSTCAWWSSRSVRAVTAAAFTAGTVASRAIAPRAIFPGGGGVDADHAAHPLDVLEVADGFLLSCGVGQFDKGKAPFAARFPVEGKAALGDLSVGAEEIQ